MVGIFQIVGITFSFFLAFVIIRKRNYRFYGIAFSLCGLILLEKYLWQTGYIWNVPNLVEVFVPLSFSIPVCLYLGSIKSSNSKINWGLFIISMLPYINFLPLYFASIEYKTCYIQYEIIDSLTEDCYWIANYAPTFINDSFLDIFLILEFVVLLFLLRFVKRESLSYTMKKSKAFFSSWNNILFGLVCFACICTILGILFFSDTLSVNSFFIPIIGLVTSVFIIDNSTLFKKVSRGNSYKNISKKEISILYSKIERLLQEEKYYTDNGLTLVNIAQEMNLSANKLSYVLSSSNTSFKELINTIRIKNATKFMETDAVANYSIEGIAKMFGYKSKSTFYKNFKKRHFKTPNEYIKEYRNGSII